MRTLPRTVVAGAAQLAALAALAAFAATPLAAQGGDPSTATGLRRELIAQLEEAERKFVQLAEAMPQEKYAWRPAPGVRSVGEVYMHMVVANYQIPPVAGVARAPGVTLTPDSEKTVTAKAAIVDHLKQSFAYAKQAVMNVPEAAMDSSVTLFGRPSTRRNVLVLMATHAHEHLGQSIAYARTNGVRPPWSRGADGGD